MNQIEENLIFEYTSCVAGVFTTLMTTASEEARQKVREAGEKVSMTFGECLSGGGSLANFKKALSEWSAVQLATIEEARPKPKVKRKREVGITSMQWAFIRAYPECLNGAEAARRAGYSRRSCRQSSFENLKNPAIRAEIDRLKAAGVRPGKYYKTP